MRCAALAVSALALVLAACGALSSAPARVRTFRLEYPPPAAADPSPTAVTLRVLRFSAMVPYDRQGFVYRDGPYDIGVDDYNRWLANPSEMVTDLLARDLAASKAYQAVLVAPSALPVDFELNGQIETFEERGGNGCTAALRLRVLLVRVPPKGPRRVVLQDVFAADEPCKSGDPAAFAEAMSRAMQNVSNQVQIAVRAAVAQNASGVPSS
jgi:ABC-type uncharacterized transport system auxiliary subunit